MLVAQCTNITLVICFEVDPFAATQTTLFIYANLAHRARVLCPEFDCSISVRADIVTDRE
jgi:hypothetical protein